MTEAERLVRTLFERVWNANDLDAVDDLLAEQYTIHHDPGDPWEGNTLTHAGFKERLTISRSPFPDLNFEIEEVVADDDRVAVNWIMRGTNTGELAGRPPNGRSIEARGITIYYVKHGRITGHNQAMDRLAVMQQMGFIG